MEPRGSNPDLESAIIEWLESLKRLGTHKVPQLQLSVEDCAEQFAVFVRRYSAL